MFEAGSRAIVAVSGGPDSLCLLHAMARLSRLLRVEVVCFHFDHRLREGSERDAAYVRGQSARLGVPFVLRAAASRPRRGESVEAWARAARYGALTQVIEEMGGGVGAVAHTADDQAETVLLAFLRGGGLEALGGMAPVRSPIVRPLLSTTRAETEAFCRALLLRPRRDPANRDLALMRAALRGRVIPQLERSLGRSVRPTLVRSAELLRRDADLLQALAGEALDRLMARGRGPDGPVALDRVGLASLPPALAGRVVRLALMRAGIAPTERHVAFVLDVARGARGRSASLPRGLRARREGRYVRLSRPSPGPRAAPAPESS